MKGIRETAIDITKTLSEAGHTTYFAGGCVRDSLLGKTPKDYDIATSATPDDVLKLFPHSDAIGAHFGVILVKKNKYAFEITTFRTDGSYSDSRHPDSVTFSSPEEDAARRDFTVNGLFEHPLSGEIMDFIDGENDLSKKTIRAIGKPEERFQEDALRLMRAIRFATVLEFGIETETWTSIKKHAALLSSVSVERIQGEFNKIITHPNRRKGIELLIDSGLMHHIIPEVYDLIGCEQPPQFHPEGDVYTHTCIMLEILKDHPSVELSLSVLLHDIAKPATYTYSEEENRIRFNGHDQVGAEMAETILKRLRYSNAVIDDVCSMVSNHMNFMHITKMRKSKVKRFMARPTYEDEMELHRVDCASSNGITENYNFLRKQEEVFAAEPLIPPPLLTGKDLIQKGLHPGPRFKEILKNLQTEQLEGTITSHEEAHDWLDKLLTQ